MEISENQYAQTLLMSQFRSNFLVDSLKYVEKKIKFWFKAFYYGKQIMWSVFRSRVENDLLYKCVKLAELKIFHYKMSYTRTE